MSSLRIVPVRLTSFPTDRVTTLGDQRNRVAIVYAGFGKAFDKFSPDTLEGNMGGKQPE